MSKDNTNNLKIKKITFDNFKFIQFHDLELAKCFICNNAYESADELTLRVREYDDDSKERTVDLIHRKCLSK